MQYIWRTRCHERKVCRKGDRSAWCWARMEQSLCSAPLLFCAGLFHPSLHHYLPLTWFLSDPPTPRLPQSLFHLWLPIWSCVCHFSVPIACSFFVFFWPQSHFPNWLSGSLIIPRHPCCRLFYLSACRHPNPLISKYPSSAHIALQQPTAFLVLMLSI